jgi:phytoene dehydrogenase-like protein
MSMADFDIIIIGAGHNGLVAGTYLAKAGKKVLLLERRDRAGGQLDTEGFGEGMEVDVLHAGGRLRPDIVKDLGLALPAANDKPAYISLLPDGKRLLLRADGKDAETLASIRQFSEADAACWPEFVAFMDMATAFLDAAYRTPMPRLPKIGFAEGAPLAMLAWKLRRLGGKDMFRVIRSLSMSAVEFTEDWFESEPLKASIAAVAIHGSTLGSMSAGTGYTLIHNWLNRGGLAQPAGGLTPIRDALLSAFKSAGGQLRIDADVQRILVEKQKVRGVRLTSGEEISAGTVISAADPRHTLLSLIGAVELPPEFVWQAQSIKLRGSVAKVHLLTDGKHGLPAGTLAVAPTLKYLERAFDAAKYGEISAQPYLEVTTSGKTVSIHFQFAPYSLRNSDWATQRATLEQIAVDTLAQVAPGLRASVQRLQSITPLDIETDYGLSEGDLNHGQLILDQIFFMRPLPGWSNHRTPIDGVWLCGSGGHGGGGISGASGRNAARAILKIKG